MAEYDSVNALAVTLREAPAGTEAWKRAAEDLWASVERFAAWQLRRLHAQMEDGMQIAFFAMVQAAAVYDAERGNFTQIFALRLKSAYYRSRGMNWRDGELLVIDALNRAVSIDTPIEEDGLTIGDTLIDEAAEAEYTEIERRELAGKIRQLVSELPADERSAIHEAFYEEATVTDKAAYNRAIRHLRGRNKELKPYR